MATMRLRNSLLLPNGQGLSHTGRLVVRTAGWSLLGGVLLTVAVVVGGFDDVRSLLAGALLGWGGGVISWAVFSARHNREDISRQIRHHAEYTVIHRRLNEIAAAVGAREIDLAGELESEVNHLESMVAHLTGLEEFRS